MEFKESNYPGPVIPLNMQDPVSFLTLKKEFKKSKFHQEVAQRMYPDYPMWRKIRGDGNCCYRAVYVQYLEYLICKSHMHLQDLQNLIKSNKGIFRERWKLPEKELILVYLNQLRNKKRNGQPKSEVLQTFHSMVLFSQHFDLGMIKLLRVMVANLITKNPGLEIEGLPIHLIMDPRYGSIEEYLHQNVLVMGTEAQDLIVELLPIVLRISIKTVILDKSAGNGGILEHLKKPFIGKEKVEYDDSLNLHDTVLVILLKPGHYDILYSKEFLEITGMDNFEQQEELKKQLQNPVKRSPPLERKSKNEANSASRPVSVDIAAGKYNIDKSAARRPESTTLNLHCLHKVNRQEMQSYLDDKFSAKKSGASRFLVINEEKQRKTRPKCVRCSTPLSFQDLLSFDSTLKRKEFSTRQKEWTSCDFKEVPIEVIRSIRVGRQSIRISDGGLRFDSEPRKEEEGDYLKNQNQFKREVKIAQPRQPRFQRQSVKSQVPLDHSYKAKYWGEPTFQPMPRQNQYPFREIKNPIRGYPSERKDRFSQKNEGERFLKNNEGERGRQKQERKVEFYKKQESGKLKEQQEKRDQVPPVAMRDRKRDIILILSVLIVFLILLTYKLE